MSAESIAALTDMLADEQTVLDNLVARVQELKPRPTGNNGEALADNHKDIKGWKKDLKTARAEAREQVAAVADLKKNLEKLDPSNKVFTKLDTSNLGACKLQRNALTTPRDCMNFARAYATHATNTNRPFVQHNKVVYYNLVNAAFAQTSPVTEEEDKWIDTLRQGEGVPVEEFEARLIREFAKSDHQLSAKKQLVAFMAKGQGKRNVAAVAKDFARLWKSANYKGDPPMGWNRDNAPLVDDFKKFVNQNIKDTIRSHFAPRLGLCMHDFETYSHLAAEAETLMQTLENEDRPRQQQFVTPNKNGGGGKNQQPGAKKLFNGEQAKKGYQGNGSKQKFKACDRCGKNHHGGASSCFAVQHRDGTTITSPPTAKNPYENKDKVGGFIQPHPVKQGCANCGDKFHKVDKCPRKQNPGIRALKKRKDRQWNRGGRKRTKRAYNSEASGETSASASDAESE